MKQPELGKTISELRKQKGFTQEELVDLCNINVRTIQRIEAGEVTPRLYTIKTILAALDYDLNKLSQADRDEIPVSLKDTTAIAKFRQVLILAMVFGGVYFFLGIAEFFADWSRWFDDEMYFSNSIYITIKVAVLISYVIFIRGFIETGHHFQNTMLKLSGVLMAIVTTLFYAYELASLYNEFIPMEIFLPAMSIVGGAIGLFFGVGILKLRKQFGTLALATGILEITISVMFLTVILAWLGYVFLTPAILLELFLLYRISKFVEQT